MLFETASAALVLMCPLTQSLNLGWQKITTEGERFSEFPDDNDTNYWGEKILIIRGEVYNGE